jgi:hypothetical protein
MTNRSFVTALDEPAAAEAGVAYGFKIEKFPTGRGSKSFLEAVEAREKHLELHWLLKAQETHVGIPSTFDDRTPAETFSSASDEVPLRIGEIYMVPNEKGEEVAGLLTEATVAESEKRAVCVFQMPGGISAMHTIPLSDNELARYRQSRETFFDVIKNLPATLKYPLDAFDFIYASYARTPREKLLEFIADWPQLEAWRELPQEELAKRYSARVAEGLWAQFAAKKPGP